MAVLHKTFEVVTLRARRGQHVGSVSSRQPAEAIGVRGKSEIQQVVADDDLVLQRHEGAPRVNIVGGGFRIEWSQTIACGLGCVVQEISLNVLISAEVVPSAQQIVSG